MMRLFNFKEFNMQGQISITVIVGLPGAGKTTLAKQLLDGQTFLIDDFSLNVSKVEDFKNSEMKKVIITDPYLCEVNKETATQVLNDFFGYNISVTWFAFENNPEICIHNVEKRNDGRIVGEHFIKSLSDAYNPLSFTDTVTPVFKS